jgi:hypothetical protein
MAGQQVTANQLAAIPLFDGKKGLEALSWAESVDRAQAQFNWSEEQTASAAIIRGHTSMANWIRAERAANIEYTRWAVPADVLGADNQPLNPQPDDRPPVLRARFLNRFGPVYTAAGACSALTALKQKPQESCADYMDRVKLTIDMVNYNVPAAQRNNQAYRDNFERLVVNHFGSGLAESIKRVVWGVPVPPATIDEALAAASAVEVEDNRKLAESTIVNAVQAEEPTTDDTVASAPPAPAQAPPRSNALDVNLLNEVKADIDRVLAITGNRRARGNSRPRRRQPNGQQQSQNAGGNNNNNFANYTCYGCGQRGHIRSNCRNQPMNRNPPARGGRTGQGGFFTRRGAFQSNFAPNRGRPVFYAEEQDDVGYWPLTGNYQGSGN